MGIMMPKPVRINGSTSYYLRVRVPADVMKIAKGTTIAVPVGPKVERVKITNWVKASLRTKDVSEAKRRFVDAHSALLAHWDVVRSGPEELTHRATLAIAGEIRKTLIDIMDDEPGTVEMWDAILGVHKRAIAGRPAGPFGELVVPTDQTKEAELEKLFGGLVDNVLLDKGLIVAQSSRARLLEYVAKALNEAAEVNKAKAEGDYSDSGETTKYPAIEKPHERNSRATTKATRWTFNGIIDREVEDGEESRDTVQRRDKTMTKFRRATDEFVTFRKNDDVETVTSQELDDWVRALKRAGKLGNNTIGQRLQSVSVVINWGRTQSLGTLFPNNNPADIVSKPEFQEMPSEERSFTLDEAEAVLKAARHETKLDRRWLPWLAAYSGARINNTKSCTRLLEKTRKKL